MNLQDSAQRGCSYSFLHFTIDLAAERLVGGTSEIKLRPKSFQVLHYLVESHGRLVTRDELMQAVWGDVTVTDESITKCIADIRKALADDSQEIVRTVPRRGFIFQSEVRILPPTAARHEQQMPPRIGGRRAILFAGTAVFALVAGLVWLQWRGYLSGRRPTFEAIAVLPFESLSHGEDQQYLADGMTEALITDLGQASPLRVIARTSVNQYLKTKKSIREIARELNVDVMVEGTIAQSGDRLRVTANLIQVSPEKHIWAHSYERNFRDALTLQNEIAGAIAGEIQGKLTPRQQSRLATNSPPVNREAQIAYWKARYFLNARRDPEAAQKSVEFSEQAVRMDPGYAPAQAALAMSYALLGDMGRAMPSVAMSRAKAAAQRAVALDERLADAHDALGSIFISFDWDWAGAEREIRRAISLNPSDAEAHQLLSLYLQAVGRVDEGLVEIKRARELDPLSFHINRNVGRGLYLARRYDDALLELQQIRDMQSNPAVVDVWIAKCYFMKGQADEAVAVDLRLHANRDRLNARSLDDLRAAYAQKGLRAYWTKVRKLVLPSFSSDPNGVYRLAEINAYLDDKEEAFRWLEKAYEYRTNWMPWIKVEPTLDPLRSDPRFGTLLRRMGLLP